MKTIRFEGVDHQFPDEATDEEIAQALEDLSAPPAPTGRMGRDAEGAFGMGPDPEPERSALFPSSRRAYEERFSQPAGSIGQSALDMGAVGLAGADDVMGIPTRAIAKFRGQEMSDPNAYILRPEVEAKKAQIMAQPDLQSPAPMGPEDPALHRPPPEVVAGMVEMLGRLFSDPVIGAPLLRKVIGMAPKAFQGLGRGAGLLNEQVGALAEDLSGVPEATLRAYGDPTQRAKMAANFGKEKEIGDELLQNLENADDFLPERQVVDQALDQMGPIDLGSAVQSMERAKGAPIAGRLSPEKGAANSGIQKYIDFLRGGPLPEDLAEGAQAARRAASDAGTEAVAAGARAGQDARAAAQATRQQQSAQSKAGKAAANVTKARKDAQDAFYSWDKREAEGAIPKALAEARQAAQQAKEASTQARARVALGEVSEGEAKAAERAAETASRRAEVMEAASRLKGGASRKAIADALAAKGMDKDGIRDVLKAAITKADEVGELPPQTVTAREYRDLRRDLDVPVNWEQEGAGIKNQALKTGRTTMKNELLRKAEESGNPEYAQAMRSWSDKLDKLEGIKDLLGKTGSTRDRRVEQFINNLFGKNSEHKQQLMRDLDEIFQSDLTGRAKAAQQASELGPKGRPAIVPQQVTGAALKPFLISQFVPVLGQAAAASTASPLVASRITLPMLTKLEEGLKAAGVALTPKAQKAMEALKKPASDVQKARLASILAAELEAQVPANAIPFHIQRAAEVDTTEESPRAKKLRAALEKAKDEKTRARLQAELDRELGNTLSMKGN